MSGRSGAGSSLVAYEGVDALLRAGAALRARGERVRVLVVGEGADRNRLEALATDSPGLCVFTGNVPRSDVRRFHHAIDVFVLPRRDWSVCRLVSPLKPVEALGCGRPVVATDLPPQRELITHGVDGLLVQPESDRDLQEALQSLVASEDLRRTMGEHGRTKVAATRTWTRNAATYDRLYASLLGRAGDGMPVAADHRRAR